MILQVETWVTLGEVRLKVESEGRCGVGSVCLQSSWHDVFMPELKLGVCCSDVLRLDTDAVKSCETDPSFAQILVGPPLVSPRPPQLQSPQLSRRPGRLPRWKVERAFTTLTVTPVTGAIKKRREQRPGKTKNVALNQKATIQ